METITRQIDMPEKIGTTDRGKYADIIAVEGNPLENSKVLDSVAVVMKGGVFIKARGVSG